MTKLEAFKILLNIDQENIIDDEWFDYFRDNAIPLIALFTLCDTMSYNQVQNIYEDYTIKEFLEDRLK